jgi:hypothetical protein
MADLDHEVVLTPMERLAARIMEMLQHVSDEIPGLEYPSEQTKDFVRGHRTVPEDLIATMIDIVEQNRELDGTNVFNAAYARETLDFAHAFHPVIINKVRNLLTSLVFTVESRKARSAAQALAMYQILQVYARDPNYLPGRATYPLEKLQGILKKRGRRKKKAQPENEGESTTPTPE